MVKLTKVQARSGFRLYLEFADGTRGEVEMASRMFGPVFQPLKDPEYFARVTLTDYGAPRWPNGVDLAPDALYERVRQGASAAASAGH